MGKRAAAVAVAASSSRTKTQDADVVVYPDEEDDDALVVVLPPPLLKKKKREEDTSPSLCPVSAPNAAVVVSDEKQMTTDESLFLSSSSSSSATELSDLITANNHTTAQEVVVELQQPHQQPLSSKAGVSIVAEAGHLHYDRQNKFQRERPARITAILNALQYDKNVWDRCTHMNILKDEDDDDLDSAQQIQQPLSSSSLGSCLLDDDQDYLRRVHGPGYLQRLEKISSSADRCGCGSCNSSTSKKGDNDCCLLDGEAEQYTSIFLTRHSVSEAQKAVRALCLLTERVVLENRRHRHQELSHHNSEGIGNSGGDGFAIIRPPGHHAEPSLAGGYCLYNNVGVAASYAHHKLNCRKILILDWDVHHGNGTERMFWNDPNILYFSVHRYDGGAFYPGTGSPNAVGGTEARGRTINVGWSQPHMGDAEYVAVWKYVLLPVLAEFDPDLVLVSAGFDAADGDELGGCHVFPRDGFGRLTRLLKRQLRDVASLRRPNNNSDHKEYNEEAVSTSTSDYPAPVVCALEGGYARSVMGRCVVEVVRALLDENDNNDNKNAIDHNDEYSMDDGTLDSIHPAAARNIRQTLQAQAPYWKCLQEVVS